MSNFPSPFLPEGHPLLPEGHPITPERLRELARHLFGQHYQWSKLDMLDYDNNAARRERWERNVAGQILELDSKLEEGEG